MTAPRHLDFEQVTILVGLTLVAAAVAGVVIYVVHRMARSHHDAENFRAKPLRSENETAFVSATVQGVIADLKGREKLLTELCRKAEERATFSRNALEAIASHLPYPLLVFDRAGFLALANAAARGWLHIDVWSRRKYSDLLSADSPLALAVEGVLSSGVRGAVTSAEFAGAESEKKLFSARVASFGDWSGEAAGVICIVQEKKDETAD